MSFDGIFRERSIKDVIERSGQVWAELCDARA